MPKRQKAESEDDLSDDSFVVEDDEKPKKKKAAPKKAAAGKKKKDDGDEKDKKEKPKKEKAPPPPPNPSEPTTYPDGWTVVPPSFIYKANPLAQGGTKIAAIDLDGTLITRKSGLAYAVDAKDWQWYNAQVIEKLKAAVDDGYQVLIVSNQGSIKKALLGLSSVKTRTIIDAVLTALAAQGVYAQVTISTDKDNFRKPETGMWDFFVANLNKGVVPNKEESFFVGDAAGRAGDINDNSDSDKAFAANIGVKFYTPQEYFGPANLVPTAVYPSNQGLVASFFELATLLKDSGEQFKSGAFFKVAKLLSDHNEEVTSGKSVKDVKGIGKSSMDKIDEFIRTGKMAAIDEFKNKKKDEEVFVSKEAAAALPFL